MGRRQFETDLDQIFAMASLMETIEPREVRFAVSRMLTDMAFQARKQAIGVIDRHMDVRSKGYVRKTLTTEKARPYVPISSMVASMGTQALPGTTGWVEQEFGTTPKQEARHGLASRGRNARRKVQRKRYRTGKAYTARDFRGVNDRQRETVMLTQLRFWEEKQAQFIASGNGIFGRGIYGFDGRYNPVWLSTIDRAPRTKRLRWLTITRNQVMLSYPVRRKFDKEYLSQLQRRLRRRLGIR